MASQCFICATEFTFFKKELGCANCGHSVCKKCCSKKAVVPKLGTKLQHVCTKCYERLTNPNSDAQNRENRARYSPPLNFKKRLEAQAAGGESDGSGGSGGTPVSHSGIPSKGRYRGLSPKDKAIAERLDKLKAERRQERGPVPSTSEMEERLAKLKGMDPEVFKQPSKPVYHPPDNRTFYDQFDDLMTEVSDEVALDDKISGHSQDGAADPTLRGEINPPTSDTTTIAPVDGNTPQTPDSETSQQQQQQQQQQEDAKKLSEEASKLIEQTKETIKLAEGKKTVEQEVEERLAKLRGDESKTQTDEATASATTCDNDDDDDITEEEARKRVIKAIMDEDALDEKVRSQGYGELLDKAFKRASSIQQEDIPIDPDELPWCCICNHDAVLRCHSCDNELFCKRCFGLGHDKIDRHDHKTTPYPPAGVTMPGQ